MAFSVPIIFPIPSKIFHSFALSIFYSLEVVGLAGVPVAVGDGLAVRHPEELALLALVGAGGPEVLVTHACRKENYTLKKELSLRCIPE